MYIRWEYALDIEQRFIFDLHASNDKVYSFGFYVRPTLQETLYNSFIIEIDLQNNTLPSNKAFSV